MKVARLPLPEMDGTWEKPGRNPALGSLVIVLVLGSIYFISGNALTLGAVLAKVLSSRQLFAGSGNEGFFDLMGSLYGEFRFWILLATVLCQWGVLFLAGIIVSRRAFSRRLKAYAGYGSATAGMVALGALGALLILPLADLASFLTYSGLPRLEEFEKASASLYHWDGPAEAAFVFFGIAFTPAICEEFLFRGIFQRTLQRRLRFPWHFIASGTVFALYHQSPFGLFALLPVGIFLGILYWASGSIWPGMVFHASYNGIILLLVNDSLPLPSYCVSGDYFSWPVWTIGTAGIIALSAFLARKGLSSRGRSPESA